ncbi:MAG: hypothetical protein IT303_11840 [Dehalococcoidia bacterium]|nr:hypothetical protein [Dehalococcoidia bacterium]
MSTVAEARVLDRDGREVGELAGSRGGYLEVRMSDGTTRWFVESLALDRSAGVVRLGLRRESLSLYGLRHRPVQRVVPESFLG